jgi:hypothetical protein
MPISVSHGMQAGPLGQAAFIAGRGQFRRSELDRRLKESALQLQAQELQERRRQFNLGLTDRERQREFQKVRDADFQAFQVGQGEAAGARAMAIENLRGEQRMELEERNQANREANFNAMAENAEVVRQENLDFKTSRGEFAHLDPQMTGQRKESQDQLLKELYNLEDNIRSGGVTRPEVEFDLNRLHSQIGSNRMQQSNETQTSYDKIEWLTDEQIEESGLDPNVRWRMGVGRNNDFGPQPVLSPLQEAEIESQQEERKALRSSEQRSRESHTNSINDFAVQGALSIMKPGPEGADTRTDTERQNQGMEFFNNARGRFLEGTGDLSGRDSVESLKNMKSGERIVEGKQAIVKEGDEWFASDPNNPGARSEKPFTSNKAALHYARGEVGKHNTQRKRDLIQSNPNFRMHPSGQVIVKDPDTGTSRVMPFNDELLGQLLEEGTLSADVLPFGID